MTQSIRWLQTEIADRMLQKLDIVKLEAKDILVIPAFPGPYVASLDRRFPKAALHSVFEHSGSGLSALGFEVSRKFRSFFRGGSSASLKGFLASGQIGLPDNSVDLILSDLLIHDLPDPRLFLRECRRVLREGGLLTFSYFGPDTGKELFALNNAQTLNLQPLTSPWDMHDMGDALLGERFSDPVMDMEIITLDYESEAVFLSDARALQLVAATAFSNSLSLSKKLTLEVIYGHAWVVGKHLTKVQNQVTYIDPNQIKRKTSSDSA